MGLEDENKRKQIEFFIKYGTVVVAAIWLLWSGTDLIDKRGKLLSVEAMPVGDTNLTVNWNNQSRVVGGKEFCDLTAFYSVKNAGKLAFKVRQVKFNVYRLYDVKPSDYPTGKLVSYTLSKRLTQENLVPGFPEVIRVEEIFSPGNSLQRQFGALIPHEKAPNGAYYSYVVSATAIGGLPQPDQGLIGGLLNPITTFLFGGGLDNFGPNDLRHDSALRSICSATNTKQS